MEKKFSKGKANQDSLSDRMKRYEAVTTEVNLIERLPIYGRIDMRAGHTWCKGLDKPFDMDYANAMRKATAYIVEKTGAAIGYTQSDEASFVWLDHTKIPFETRLFKLQSVIASMFTGAFINFCRESKLEEKVWRSVPSFDCRIMNLPSLQECTNMLLWREMDSIKNSITLLALEAFSTKQIHKKNGDEKIKMLAERGVDYFSLAEDLRFGAYFKRELYRKELSDEEVLRIPEKNRPKADEDGVIRVIRSRVSQINFGYPLSQIENKVEVIFTEARPIVKQIKSEISRN